MSNETELMLQVKAGNLDCLAPLFERYKVKLFNFFRRMGNSTQQSEDLVQETFMRALAYRSSFQGDKGFSCWIYGIARNTSADCYRKNKSSLNNEELDEETLPVEETMVEQFSEQQKQELFEKSISALTPEHREVLLLSRFHQLKYDDIAQLLDCNINTLKSRIRTAISELKTRYNQLSRGEA